MVYRATRAVAHPYRMTPALEFGSFTQCCGPGVNGVPTGSVLNDKMPNMVRRHPLARRLLWNPGFVALPTAYFVHRVWQDGFASARAAGLVTGMSWFALSVFDLITKHRFLDWLYDGN
jgi:hypothetical protein